MSEEIEVLLEFKRQILSFLDELISQFPQEGDLVVMRLFFSNQVAIKDAMDNFIFKINTNDQKIRKMIKERNEEFFLNHSIFDDFSKDKVTHFKKLWLSEKLDDDDKHIIWNWFDAFIFLGDKYTVSLQK